MMRNELLRLKLLREAFPQLSDEDVAQAYSRSGRNYEAAAAALKLQVDTLAAELCKSDWITVGKKNNSKSNQAQRTSDNNKSNQARRPGDNNKKQRGRRGTKKQEQEEAHCENQQQLEEFLFNMLGGEAEIGMDIVRDVIHQCNGDAQKSLDSLLEIALTSEVEKKNPTVEDPSLRALLEMFPGVAADLMIRQYQESGGDMDALMNRLLESPCRKVFLRDPVHQRLFARLSACFPDVDKSMLLEVLRAHDFDYSATMETLADAGLVPQMADGTVAKLPEENLVRPSEVKDPPKIKDPMKVPVMAPIKTKAPPKQQKKPDEWSEYKQFCNSSMDNWATMQRYFQEAANAYHSGDRARAGLLSQKGQEYKRLARNSREKASKHVFGIHNKEYQNNITVDLHNQRVDEAIGMVKRHLDALGSISSSVHTLTLITGYGLHSHDGKSKLKAAVVAYLNRRGVDWVELNPGRMLVNLDTLAQD